jgi:hypothetical protein
MGISRAADLYYTFRFLKLLVTKWEDTDAFKEGIIDSKGKNLIKQRDLGTVARKDAYTTFHRLVFNLKRILEKVLFGKSRIVNYAAALFLLREETDMPEDEMIIILEQLGYEYILEDETTLAESTFTVGEYMLNRDMDDEFKKGMIITIDDTNPIGKFSNTLIYKTKENCFVTIDNLT